MDIQHFNKTIDRFNRILMNYCFVLHMEERMFLLLPLTFHSIVLLNTITLHLATPLLVFEAFMGPGSITA